MLLNEPIIEYSMITSLEEGRLNPKHLGSQLVGLFLEATVKYYLVFLQLHHSNLAFLEEDVPAIVWLEKQFI